MTRAMPLLLLALLAGCTAGPPANTPQAACRRAVLQDPEVHSLLVRSVPGSAFANNNARRLADAKDRAYTDCMVRKGLAVPGGVERVNPVY